MRVALVHERFTEDGGSERVVEQLHLLWPTATIHTTIVDPSVLSPLLHDAEIRPSPLRHLYRGGRSYAHLLPLLPWAIRRIHVGDVDLVVTSHHAFANRVRAPAGVPVVSYTHTPARWIWDPVGRRNEVGGRFGALALTGFAATQRRPDRDAANRLRGVITNSTHVAERVRHWWRRDAQVIPPPADVEFFTCDPSVEREDFFLVAGRLVPYKRPELAVAAARRAGVRVVVSGEGRLRPQVEALAAAGTEILGEVERTTLRDLYRRCRALVLPGVEDFGIVPVEAQACGAPVLAPARGGVLDSVVDGVTGRLYPSGVDAITTLAEEMQAFDPLSYDPVRIREHAEQFSAERFRARVTCAVHGLLSA
jgi:glycosyltransferase involved in cell wall biosynthesis